MRIFILAFTFLFCALPAYATNSVFQANDPDSSIANGVQVIGGATGNAPVIMSTGSDTNVGLIINTQGSGVVSIGTASAGSKLNIYGGVSIGTGYVGTASPLNGMIVQGNVGIGTTAPTAGSALDLSYNTNSMILPVGTTGQEPASPVNGMIRYNSTTGAIEGYINGAWTAVSGGGLVKLASATASSSANITFTNIPSGYDQYEVRFTSVIPATTGQVFYALVSEDNCSTVKTSNYAVTASQASSDGGGGINTQTSYMFLGGAAPFTSTAGMGVSGQATFYSLSSTSLYKFYNYQSTGQYTGPLYVASEGGGGYVGDTGAVNCLQFQFASGNIASGDFTLYGLQK
jgi:hypothetical protein